MMEIAPARPNSSLELEEKTKMLDSRVRQVETGSESTGLLPFIHLDGNFDRTDYKSISKSKKLLWSITG